MPVPKLSNHKINKARLTFGKYLTRYVEKQTTSIFSSILSMCIFQERVLSIQMSTKIFISKVAYRLVSVSKIVSWTSGRDEKYQNTLTKTENII